MACRAVPSALTGIKCVVCWWLIENLQRAAADSRVSGVPGCDAFAINTTKPVFVFGADVSEVSDVSAVKGGVAKAVGWR